MIAEIITFLNTNAAGLAIAVPLVISIVAGAFKFWQFVNIKNKESKQIEYENYHNLIEKLVTDRNEKDGTPFIDVQIASVFELKNFPRYSKATVLILNRMKKRLLDKEIQKDLVGQIDKTLFEINKNWFIKLFS